MWALHHALGLYGFLRLKGFLKARGWQGAFDSPWFAPVRMSATFGYVILGYAWVGTHDLYSGARALSIAFGFGDIH